VKSSFQSRCIILCLVLVAGLSVLSARLVQIQLVDRKRYAESARKTYHRTEVLPAIRGMIVDRREEPLARSRPVVSVFVDLMILKDPNMAALGLAYQEASAEPGWSDLEPAKRRQRILALRSEILRPRGGESLTPEETAAIVNKHLAYAVGLLARPMGLRRDELHQKIEKAIAGKLKWFPVAKELPQDVGDQLRAIVESERIQGFEFENSVKRWYPAPTLATHVVGFTGEDKGTRKVVGKFGIESAMEAYLAGKDGSREHMRDIRGLVVPGNPEDLVPPRAGLNVKLTLDMGIQSIVEEELDAGLARFKAKKGTVILMEPKTGEILAMASRPHFNLNHKESLAEEGVSVNYAIQSVYEPGSTIKIVAAAGALNERLVTPQTSIFCFNGLYQGKGYRVRDDFPAAYLSFEAVLQKSNNNGTYSLARQLGSRRFYDYLHDFGFGKKTGILLSGERAGMARNTNNEADFSRASFGYATNITPLQLTCAYAAVASDGKLRKPHIVKAVVANDGLIIQDYPPEVVREVLTPKSAAQMRAALEKVVVSGTAKKAAVPGFRVGGKTGTVKKHNPAGGYYKDRYIASFAGMMPAADPAFVAVVVIDDPRGPDTHGGPVAGSVFSSIGSRVAAHLNLQPTEPLTLPLVSAQ
jgi:cell division protein FtsI/penicillin-binding protein 2